MPHLRNVKRLPLLLAQLVLSLAFLSGFGWVVKHRTQGDLNLGFANALVDHLVGFPDLFQQSVTEVQGLPQTFIPTPAFTAINRLKDDVLTL